MPSDVAKRASKLILERFLVLSLSRPPEGMEDPSTGEKIAEIIDQEIAASHAELQFRFIKFYSADPAPTPATPNPAARTSASPSAVPEDKAPRD